jgi:membrane protein implicated in regulation of membrane protease activity
MIIYGAIAAFGIILLLSMLLVGEIFGGDHDAGHDAGHGDADHGGGPSVFSTRIMASFLTAFGVGGVIGRYYDLSHPAASGVGVFLGVVMSGIVYQFARLLYSQQASSELHMTGLVGTAAEVSVAIPADGVGQIVITTGGERTEHIARSADQTAITRGTSVIITGIGGDAVAVAPAGHGRGGIR